MSIKKHYLLIGLFLIFILSIAQGCSHKELLPKNYPDYSSPEAVFWTTFYAMQHKDYKTIIESMTDEYRSKYGKNLDEQVAVFAKNADKIVVQKNRTRSIIKIQYENTKDYDVKITWSEKIGSKYSVKNSWLYLKRVGNEWKIASPKSEI